MMHYETDYEDTAPPHPHNIVVPQSPLSIYITMTELDAASLTQLICKCSTQKMQNRRLETQIDAQKLKYEKLISSLMREIDNKSKKVTSLMATLSDTKSKLDHRTIHNTLIHRIPDGNGMIGITKPIPNPVILHSISTRSVNQANLSSNYQSHSHHPCHRQQRLLYTDIMLQCKEMKQPIDAIKSTLKIQIKCMENDFDILWDRFKSHIHGVRRMTQNSKSNRERIQVLEQTANELNDLCVEQNQMISKLHLELRRSPNKRKNRSKSQLKSPLKSKIRTRTRSPHKSKSKVRTRKQSRTRSQSRSTITNQHHRVHPDKLENHCLTALLQKVENDTIHKLHFQHCIHQKRSQISDIRAECTALKVAWTSKANALSRDWNVIMHQIADKLDQIQNDKNDTKQQSTTSSLTYYQSQFEQQQYRLRTLEQEMQRLRKYESAHKVLSQQNESLFLERETLQIDLLRTQSQHDGVLKEVMFRNDAQTDKLRDEIDILRAANEALNHQIHLLQPIESVHLSNPLISTKSHQSNELQIATEIMSILNVDDVDSKISTLHKLMDNLTSTGLDGTVHLKDANIQSSDLQSQQIKFYQLCNQTLSGLIHGEHRHAVTTPQITDKNQFKNELKNEFKNELQNTIDTIDWKQKYKNDVSFLNGLLRTKIDQIQQIKNVQSNEMDEFNQSVPDKHQYEMQSVQQLGADIKTLIGKCQVIDTSNSTTEHYKALVANWKRFQLRIHDVLGGIQSPKNCKSPNNPKSPKSSRPRSQSLCIQSPTSRDRVQSPHRSHRFLSGSPRRNRASSASPRIRLHRHSRSIPRKRAQQMFDKLQSMFLHQIDKSTNTFTVIQLIRDEGAILSAKEWNLPLDDENTTFLHRAIDIDATDIMDELLLRGADPNIQTIYGQTVVHELAAKLHLHPKFMRIFKEIIQNNQANLRILNNENKTSLQMISDAATMRKVHDILQDEVKTANNEFAIQQIVDIMDQHKQRTRRHTQNCKIPSKSHE